jgi:hypothetical protein
MNWLRDNDVNFNDMDEKTLRVLTSMAGVPMPKRAVSAATKKKAMDESLNWLRNNEPNAEDMRRI